MSELEITRLCAEAMGYVFEDSLGNLVRVRFDHRSFTYRPLHDDAQAMALVKKFGLRIVQLIEKLGEPWFAGKGFKYGATNTSLNAAICECVAKLKQGE